MQLIGLFSSYLTDFADSTFLPGDASGVLRYWQVRLCLSTQHVSANNGQLELRAPLNSDIRIPNSPTSTLNCPLESIAWFLFCTTDVSKHATNRVWMRAAYKRTSVLMQRRDTVSRVTFTFYVIDVEKNAKRARKRWPGTCGTMASWENNATRVISSDCAGSQAGFWLSIGAGCLHLPPKLGHILPIST